MKKHWIAAIAVLLCVAMAGCMLTGCSKKAKDGTYTARYRYPSHGYVEYLTVTFKSGKPTSAEFDAYSETDPNSKKSQLTAENYPMDPTPSVWMKELAKNVVAAGDNPDKITTVAGATSSSKHARELYNAILNAAKSGTTGEIIVDNEEEAPDSTTTDNSVADSMSQNSTGTDTTMDNSMSDTSGSYSDNSTGTSDSTLNGTGDTTNSGTVDSTSGNVPDSPAA